MNNLHTKKVSICKGNLQEPRVPQIPENPIQPQLLGPKLSPGLDPILLHQWPAWPEPCIGAGTVGLILNSISLQFKGPMLTMKVKCKVHYMYLVLQSFVNPW